MPVIIVVFVIMVLIIKSISAESAKTKKNEEAPPPPTWRSPSLKRPSNQENSSKSNRSYNTTYSSSLNHSDCDIFATSCLHEENIDKDQKICRNCGYQNEKGKKNCSVCGKRL